MSAPQPAADLPPGDYAIVEMFGHDTLVGRVTETERFGGKFLSVEPLFDGALLPPTLIGASAIFRLTGCTPQVAAGQQPRHRTYLPRAIAVTVPQPAIAAPPAPVTLDVDIPWIDPDPPLPYILRWTQPLDGPSDISLVGPFSGNDPAAEWAKDPANNPDDDPRWHVVQLRTGDLHLPLPHRVPEIPLAPIPGIGTYVLRWDARGEGSSTIELVGPFADRDQATVWAIDRVNNPEDTPCWQLVRPTTEHLTLPLVVHDPDRPSAGDFA